MSELSQEARALIDSVSTLDDPSEADRTRIRKRLALQLGASAFATAAASNMAGVTDKALAANKSGLFGLAGKAALCAGALCAAGSIWLLDWHGQPTRRAAQERAPAAIAAPSMPTAATPVEQTSEPALAPASPEPAVAVQPTAAQSASPVGAVRARRKAREPAQAEQPEPRPSAVPSGLSAELSLLGRAQAALRSGQATQALALALEHEATFPDGVMREERLGVAALAECTLGTAGRDHVQVFLAQAPHSPLAARVRKTCGLE